MSKYQQCPFCNGKGRLRSFYYMSDTEARQIKIFKMFATKPPDLKQEIYFERIAKQFQISERTVARYWRQLKLKATASSQEGTEQG